MTAIEKLREFVSLKNTFGRSTWVADDTISVYVRASRRVLDGEMPKTTNCLDLATFDVPEELQKQGIFTRFLHEAEEINPWPFTYVENVLNPVIVPLLLREGWMPHPSLPMCYYKRKTTI